MSVNSPESLERQIGQLGRLNADLMREREELRKDEKRLDFLMSAFNNSSPDAWKILQSIVGRKAITREKVDEAMERSAAQ